MYKGIYILGIIPARGGSKGIPDKNIKQIAGKPLIAWTIAQAKESRLLDRTIISTDSEKIAQTAKEYGGDVPFMRPSELAEDTTPMYPVLQHALQEMEKILKRKIDIIVLLDPTSPTRQAEDIDACIKKAVDDDLDSAMTVYESDHNPYFNMVELDENNLTRIVIRPKKPIYRRQDAPKVYNIASDIYAIQRKTLMEDHTVIGKRTGAVIVPKERAGGIDNEIQFRIAESILEQRNQTLHKKAK